MKKRVKRKSSSAFETFSLADTGRRDPETNATIPTEEGVKEAKDWVDFNQK